MHSEMSLVLGRGDPNVFRGGEVAGSVVGARPKSSLREFLGRYAER